jgi:transmembrane 9 superfamily protein 2/4
LNGFAAGRLYAFLHGTDWISLWLVTSFFLPYIFGSVMIAVDICEYIETKKASAVTLSEGLALTALFIAINLPANFIGTVFGYKMAPIETPTKQSRMPREPPKGLPWFLNFHLMSIISGCVPIFVIGFELYQILVCIKGSTYIYLLYWSFYVGFIVFLVVVAQISIMQQYLLMCYEEYRWWWRCWALGAAPGVFGFLVVGNYCLLQTSEIASQRGLAGALGGPRNWSIWPGEISAGIVSHFCVDCI